MTTRRLAKVALQHSLKQILIEEYPDFYSQYCNFRKFYGLMSLMESMTKTTIEIVAGLFLG